MRPGVPQLQTIALQYITPPPPFHPASSPPYKLIFMSGCSTVLLKPAKCMRGSRRLRLRSTPLRTSSGVLLLLADTRRISAGSSRCSCSSRATPRAYAGSTVSSETCSRQITISIYL
jgi:hypothetical protein